MAEERQEQNDHIFQTVGLTKDKLEAVCRQSCRFGFHVFLDAADPTVIPPVRIFRVDFDNIDDRDRVRIAMRFVEKEMAEMTKEISTRAAAPKQHAPKPSEKTAPVGNRLAPA